MTKDDYQKLLTKASSVEDMVLKMLNKNFKMLNKNSKMLDKKPTSRQPLSQGSQTKASSSDISNVRKHYLNLILEMKTYSDILEHRFKSYKILSTFVYLISSAVAAYQNWIIASVAITCAYIAGYAMQELATQEMQKKIKSNIAKASYLLNVTLPSSKTKSDILYESDKTLKEMYVPELSVSSKEFEKVKKIQYDTELKTSNDIEILEEIKNLSSKDS
jgi:2-phospho-L-lactate transferase/gluconeogenesis factor (CofD/UPF0052 family)